MTGFDSKRKMALAKLDDDDDTQVYADTLLIVYQRGFADGKRSEQPKTCMWSPEDDDTMPGTYASTCGQLWSFIDGGWQDNRVRFCHGCGGKVVADHNIKEGT